MKFPQANMTLRAADGDPNVVDLPVYSDGYQVASCWRIPFWRRWRVLLTGRVFLVVRGTTHPPLYVETQVFGKDI